MVTVVSKKTHAILYQLSAKVQSRLVRLYLPGKLCYLTGDGVAGDADVGEQAIVEFAQATALAGALVPRLEDGEQADGVGGEDLERALVFVQERKTVPPVAGCKWMVISNSPVFWDRRSVALGPGVSLDVR